MRHKIVISRNLEFTIERPPHGCYLSDTVDLTLRGSMIREFDFFDEIMMGMEASIVRKLLDSIGGKKDIYSNILTDK